MEHTSCGACREQAKKSVQKKSEELNNLTIQHREYVLQHDGLPDRVVRLQQEVDTLQKTVDDKTREIETVKYQYAARNAQQVEKLEQLRADLETRTQAKNSDVKEAARSLAAAEASYNNELARIEGERLRQEETAQANLKIARSEAFAQGETAKRLASQLAASNAEVNALNEGTIPCYIWSTAPLLLPLMGSLERHIAAPRPAVHRQGTVPSSVMQSKDSIRAI